MDSTQYHIILFVSNQASSRDFYAHVLDKKPILDVPGMTEFQLNDTLKLGLMPENGIAKIINHAAPHPSSGNGIPRCELYIICEDMVESFSRAINHGATLISPIALRDWGHTVGYVSDPDGHLIAFASNS